jgi:alkaline phosphatase D
MSRINATCVCLLLCWVVPVSAEQPRHAPVVLERIALGSCARQNDPQPIWDAIVAARPDLFLFLGDNIYADTEDMQVMRAKYAQLGRIAGFRKLRDTCPVMAVWDDHDYGVDDGGSEYPKKAGSQQVFNDFFDVPPDSPRRRRAGIYDARVIGPVGRRVQVILLDTRYFRGPLKARPPALRKPYLGAYQPNPDPTVTMLGQRQWAWLAQQLQVPAELRIIVSSIQVLAGEHGWECWGNFPCERTKLFRTIAASRASGVVFVSGDRHRAELSAAASDETGVDYTLYDLTSSSLNQPRKGHKDEPNRLRVGQRYSQANFGMITIDWKSNDPVLLLAVRDVGGQQVRGHIARLSELRARRR